MSSLRRAVVQQSRFCHGPQQRHESLVPFVTRTLPRNTLRLPTLSSHQVRFQTAFAAAEQLPRRSVASRIARSLLTATVFVTLGVYIGWETLPSRPAIAAILSHTASDAETLSYQPPDRFSAEVNAHITRHPLAAQLRRNPELTESRPHLKIPEAIRATNLTGGTLAGSGRLTVPPLAFSDNHGKDIYILFYLGEQLCGHPGIIHGGMLATLLDEGLARCCFAALPNKIGVTASLKINYRKPAKAGEYYILRASTTKVDGRKAWVNGWIERLDGAKLDTQGEKVADAEGLFIEPRNAAIMKRIYHTD